MKRRDKIATFRFGNMARQPGDPVVFQPRKVQDGARLPLLRIACEQRFSKWENRSVGDLQRPVDVPSNTQPVTIRYGEWLPKLAASLVWRVVAFGLEREHSSQTHNSALRRSGQLRCGSSTFSATDQILIVMAFTCGP
jgi:hypothetical protein